MHAVNRAIVILMAAAAGVAAVIVGCAATGIWSAGPELVGDWIAEWLAAVADGSTGNRTVVAALAACALLVSLALLFVELRPRGNRRGYLVSQDDGGDVTVTRPTVRDFVAHVVRGVPDVRGVTVQLDDDDDGLIVICHVEANTRAALVPLGAAIRGEVRTRVGTQLGLTVSRVEAEMRMNPVQTRRPALK